MIALLLALPLCAPVLPPTQRPPRLEVLYTDVPGVPASRVPGLPNDRFLDNEFEIAVSPSGEHVFVSAYLWAPGPGLAPSVVLHNGTMLARTGDAMSHQGVAYTLKHASVRNATDAGTVSAVMLLEDAQSSLRLGTMHWTSAGTPVVDFLAGEPSPLLPGATWIQSEPHLLEDQTLAGWGQVHTPNIETGIFSGTSFLARVGEIPPGQLTGGNAAWAEIDRDRALSSDGSVWAAIGRLDDSTRVLVVNGQVYAQTTAPFAPLGGAVLTSVYGVAVSPRGVLWSLVSVPGVAYLLREGEVFTVSGAPMADGDPRHWTAPGLPWTNPRGDMVFVAYHDGPGFFGNAMAVTLNGTHLLVDSGTPIDLDGNGVLDDDTYAEWFIGRTGVGDKRVFYTNVHLADGAGNDVGFALVRGSFADFEAGEPLCESVPNSTGFAATLSSRGTASLAADDLELHAAPVPEGRFGIYLYGPNSTQTPFGFGWLCIGTPFTRTGVAVADEFDFLSLAPDFFQVGPGGSPTVGGTLYFQAWFRDAPSGGIDFNTSNALAVTFEQ